MIPLSEQLFVLMVMSAGPGGHNSPTLPTRDQPPHLAWRDLYSLSGLSSAAGSAVADDVVMLK